MSVLIPKFSQDQAFLVLHANHRYASLFPTPIWAKCIRFDLAVSQDYVITESNWLKFAVFPIQDDSQTATICALDLNNAVGIGIQHIVNTVTALMIPASKMKIMSRKTSIQEYGSRHFNNAFSCLLIKGFDCNDQDWIVAW